MKKLGIIIDSFACLTEEQAKELEYHLLPLQVEINGELVKENTINNVNLLEQIASSKSCKTSLPNLALIQETVSYCSQNYDDSIFIGVSEHLSSTPKYINTLAQEYKNIHVIKNNLVGSQIRLLIKIAQKVYQKTQNISEVKNKLEKFISQCSTYILPANLDHLIKGGRLKGFKKILLNTIKMFPLLKYDLDGTVSLATLKRTQKGALDKLVEKVTEEAKNLKNPSFQIIWGIDQSINQKLAKATEKLPIFNKEITPAAIAIHTGPDAICLTSMPSPEEN
ncbi:DegV family protein [Mycoplasmopsis citelli]|uniref:Fatty acid-binding protein DegV-like protein n=1 Tax=Mycoplasmopsis citelli TaxID=171281 RepID=A0A449B0Y8_9BACT|nr:DegV family protein [Mycoplasmopsis citelli]UUD36597.1 DegV family protein [Mycoplasmopsis citelli]VEU74236.1 fatty acid-binding protein DegV-like protein [Mycoplasmopsis citelli]